MKLQAENRHNYEQQRKTPPLYNPVDQVTIQKT